MSQGPQPLQYVRFATALQPASAYFNPVTAYYNMWRAPGLKPRSSLRKQVCAYLVSARAAPWSALHSPNNCF